jgi:hypothetical protein
MQTDESKKTKFAELLLKTPDNPFKAAMGVFDETGDALYASIHWPEDDFVKAEQKRILDEKGKAHFLPDKERLSHMIINEAEQARDPGDKHKMFRLYAEVNGMIDKPGTNVTVTNTNNRVMMVHDHGSDEDWSNKALKQQRRLVNESKK